MGRFVCKYFLPFCGLSFRFVDGFLCCAKAFKFNQVPFVCSSKLIKPEEMGGRNPNSWSGRSSGDMVDLGWVCGVGADLWGWPVTWGSAPTLGREGQN